MKKAATEDNWQNFIELCQAIKGKEQWQNFLDLFTTHAEREALAQRYVIIKDLIQNQKTQRAIAQDAKISIAKITRGSNYLKKTDAKLIRFLQNYFYEAPGLTTVVSMLRRNPP